MAFHLSGTQLRVVRKFSREARNRTVLSQLRLIILEHILPTTEQFIELLRDGGADIFAVIAKPYSIDKAVLTRLASRHRIIRHTYDELEDPERAIIDDVLTEALAVSKIDGRRILLIDVGGYFAEPVVRLQKKKIKNLSLLTGIIEDTTFGHNRYLELVGQIKVPVFSVARSPLKEIEARFVGRDAVIAADAVLRDIGVMLTGRRALVLGYGMIGSNVARSLRTHDLDVSVYDKLDHKNLQAYIDGFNIFPKRQMIAHADIIFSATAAKALALNEIEECKDGAVLASVGSKDSEFDVRSVKEQAVTEERLHSYLTEYRLSNSRAIRIMKEGTAVNFILPSLPIEILDLIFSEIFLSMMLIFKQPRNHPPGKLHTVRDIHLDLISLAWLRHVNN